MPSVRELLDLSKAAHQRYRDNVPRRVALGSGTLAVPGDATLARAALQDAQRLRRAAVDADPQFTDDAWRDETVHNHAELMAFYEAQLGQ